MTLALYGASLALGALGSAHCVTMCGGVTGLFCAAEPTDARVVGRKGLVYVLAYNAGRMLSYGSAGIALGGAGVAAIGRNRILGPQYAMRAIAAVAMIVVGLHVSRVVRTPRWFEEVGARVGAWLAVMVRPLVPLRSPWHALALGLLWGWMPCGLLYAALALALSAGSAPAGGLTMLAFAVGTLPAMVMAGGAVQWLARWMQSLRIRVVAGLLLAACGAFNGLTVLEQVGWIASPWLSHGAPSHCLP